MSRETISIEHYNQFIAQRIKKTVASNWTIQQQKTWAEDGVKALKSWEKKGDLHVS